MINQYDVVILDCDGVIFDVNLAKVEAFGNVVSQYPDHLVSDFKKYCKETFGISRYEKFRYFLTEILGVEFDEIKYQEMLKKYAEQCEEIYLNCNFTEQCVSSLESFQSHNISLYVASGSDEKELKKIFNKRKINNFFKSVHGSPKTKVENTHHIIKENPNKKIVFIGDAVSDLEAAEKNNIDFIYMNDYSVHSIENDLICKEKAKYKIGSLSELSY